jgi:hypothetical protein
LLPRGITFPDTWWVYPAGISINFFLKKKKKKKKKKIGFFRKAHWY